MVNVRRIHADEAPAVARLWDGMGCELPDGDRMTPGELASIERLLAAGAADERDFCLVALRDGRIVGFVNGSLRGEDGLTGEIETCYVVPDARRGGVGSALARAAMRWLRDRGADPLHLETWLDREDVAAFWSSLGFEPESIRMALYA
ncbi:GNAT family N-acetyltransferase [Amycolatopsis suaedae]|uniref:GNAT family N-acetyltransferase n=1 Tax=Amycolatopsis suaedae TaxID=2510978 RepID=A0A4Q7J1F2_9PSEU|nr:GNAT family N-acetyltransferase [Amycolatopsis suaedae]RZQ61230.1 GNAT family N-acetyltransferase [Amycolatopsis suaedae]